MVDVTEQAKQAYKSAIIGYLRERCKTDSYLAEACKKENKTLDGCVKYIVEQARKKAENNVAFVPDEEVYDWAVHYILEDTLNCENEKTEEKAVEKAVEKVQEKQVKKSVKSAPKKQTIADEIKQEEFDF